MFVAMRQPAQPPFPCAGKTSGPIRRPTRYSPNGITGHRAPTRGDTGKVLEMINVVTRPARNFRNLQTKSCRGHCKVVVRVYRGVLDRPGVGCGMRRLLIGSVLVLVAIGCGANKRAGPPASAPETGVAWIQSGWLV